MNRTDSNQPGDKTVNPNELLDEFDAAWAIKSTPNIEDFLLRAPETLRPKLLEDLLAVEWEYRTKFRHRFDAKEYQQRFPDARGSIEQLWKELADQNKDNAKSTNLRFQVIRVLARGGIAEILEAWDRTLNRNVAIKILQAQNVDNQDLRRRFRREAEIIAKLEHPGIIPIHDCGHFRNGEPYYAMRLVKDGLTLADRFRSDQPKLRPEVAPTVPADATGKSTQAGTMRPPDREKTEIVEGPVTVSGASDTAGTWNAGEETFEPPPALSPIETRLLLERFLTLTDTVKFAHSQGVLHRDIKPGNVILGPYGETILIDWGFALDINAKAEPGEELSEYEKSFVSSRLDSPGQTLKPFKGTPVYCSPEQAKGTPSTESCDIYSLGATLYHIMTGRPPRHGPVEAVLRDARENRFVAPSKANPAIDQAMEAIILMAMKTRPQDRYVSARDLGDDVRRWLADETVRANEQQAPLALRIARFVRRNRSAAFSMALCAGASILSFVSVCDLIDRSSGLPKGPSAESQARLDEIEARHERFASIADMAWELTQSRRAGWTKKVDALLKNLDDIRRDEPAVRFPGIESTRIARSSFSDLIESPPSDIPKFNDSITGMAFRPGTSQMLLAVHDPIPRAPTGRLHLIESESGKVLWKGIAELRPNENAEKPDGISTFAFSRDGEWLVAASRSGRGFLWKLPARPQAAEAAEPEAAAVDVRPKLTWIIHASGSVQRLCWANSTIEGLRLVSLCDDNTVSFWSWDSLENAPGGEGHPKVVMPNASRKFEAEVSDLLGLSNDVNDDRTIFAAIDGRLRKLQQDGQKPTIREIDDPAKSPDLGGPFLMTWHPSGSIVTAGRNAISIVDARSSKVLREIRDAVIDRAHHGGIASLKVTSDGQYAVTISGDELDRHLKVWNLDDPKDLIRSFPPGEPGSLRGFEIQDIATATKRKRIWVWAASAPIPFDLMMPAVYERFPTNATKVLSFDVSDKPMPRIGLMKPGETGESGPRLAVLTPHAEAGKISLELVDAASRKNRYPIDISVMKPTDSAEVAIAPNGGEVAVATGSDYVKVIDGIVKNQSSPRAIESQNSASKIIGWDDKDRIFGLFGSENEIRSLPHAAANRAFAQVLVFSHQKAKLAGPASSDTLEFANGTLFAGGSDGSVRAWNTKNPPPKGAVSRIWKTGATPLFALAVSDDGKWIVCGNQRGEMHLIDTGSNDDALVTTVEQAHPDLVSSIAIAKPSKTDDMDLILASASRDGSLKLWTIRNSNDKAAIVPLLKFPPMTGSIRKIEFIRNSKLELAVHTEGIFALRIWSIDEILAMDQAGAEAAEMQTSP